MEAAGIEAASHPDTSQTLPRHKPDSSSPKRYPIRRRKPISQTVLGQLPDTSGQLAYALFRHQAPETPEELIQIISACEWLTPEVRAQVVALVRRNAAKGGK